MAATFRSAVGNNNGSGTSSLYAGDIVFVLVDVGRGEVSWHAF